MSVPEPISKPKNSEPAKKVITNPKKRPRDDAEELEALDKACAIIKDSIPTKPYILTLPTDPAHRYHHYSKQEAQSWQENTPFGPDEEHLQYLTFHYRDYDGEHSFVIKTEVDLERERRDRERERRIKSGESTPRKEPVVPKKKIKFSDYSAKLAGRGSRGASVLSTSDPEAKQEVKQDAAMPNGVASKERPAEPAKQGEKRFAALNVTPEEVLTVPDLSTTTSTRSPRRQAAMTRHRRRRSPEFRLRLPWARRDLRRSPRPATGCLLCSPLSTLLRCRTASHRCSPRLCRLPSKRS